MEKNFGSPKKKVYYKDKVLQKIKHIGENGLKYSKDT